VREKTDDKLFDDVLAEMSLCLPARLQHPLNDTNDTFPVSFVSSVPTRCISSQLTSTISNLVRARHSFSAMATYAASPGCPTIDLSVDSTVSDFESQHKYYFVKPAQLTHRCPGVGERAIRASLHRHDLGRIMQIMSFEIPPVS
jgi:hypothetical protein